MARNVGLILLGIFALSFASADPTGFRKEHERRWNTPPELTSESIVKTSSAQETEIGLLTLVPSVKAGISLNAGHNNAHSVNLGASPGGISLSESNSYDRPAGFGIMDGSAVSVSKSTSVSAGLSGISSAAAQAYSNGNNAKTETHSLSLGQDAAASAFGGVEHGRAITGAASSVHNSQSSAASSAINREGFLSRRASRPTWNNVGPSNDDCNDRTLDQPTLIISQQPHGGTRPSLSISTHDDTSMWQEQQRPRIRIYKWRPDRRVFPRPSLSIEHQPPRSWSDHQSRGMIGLQVAAGATSSSYASPSSGSPVYDGSAPRANGDPLSFALSSTS